MGAVFASTRFSLVRISIRDLVADGKSLVRNSGVGGGGQNLILINAPRKRGRNLGHTVCPSRFTIFLRVFGAKITKTKNSMKISSGGDAGKRKISEPKKRENTIKIGISRPSLGLSGPKEPSEN